MYSLNQVDNLVSCGRDPARSLPLWCGFLLIPLILVCFAFAPQIHAVSPTPDGCYPNFTTAEGCSVLQNLVGGAANTAVGWFSQFSNVNGSFNTSLGAGALDLNRADSNTAIGAVALLLNTSGTENTAVGVDAMVFNSTGEFNGAFGGFALENNTDGFSNNAVGDHALFANVVGADNTAVGDLALQNNESSGAGTANFNTAVGAEALSSNRDGSSNNAVGASALAANLDGLFNRAMGAFALSSNTSGASNIAIGDSALSHAGAGSFNTVIGYMAGQDLDDRSDNIYIGATAAAGVHTESGTIRIGDPAHVGTCFVAGITGVPVTGTAVVVNANGKLGVALSSKRFKNEIKPMEKESESILALKSVTFRYKQEIDANRIPQFGLVAEDVAKVNPDLVIRERDGKPYTVRYEAVNAMLLNEFIKEHQTVQKLKATTDKQAARIALQEGQIQTLTAALKQGAEQIQRVSAQLEMIRPTPRVVENRSECCQGTLLEKSAFPQYIQPPRESARRLFFCTLVASLCSAKGMAAPLTQRRLQLNSFRSLQSA